MDTWEYCTVEWVWDRSTIRLNAADGESTFAGSYSEIIHVLNSLGTKGWEVAGCIASANWVYWTLKRRV